MKLGLLKGSGNAQGDQWLADVAANVKDFFSPGFELLNLL